MFKKLLSYIGNKGFMIKMPFKEGRMNKFKETGILWEPELHWIPREYFDMACKLSKFMKENDIRDLQGLISSEHHYAMKYYYEEYCDKEDTASQA